MIKIKDDLKKWKIEIKECEKEYMNKNKYIYNKYYNNGIVENINEFNDFDELEILIDKEEKEKKNKEKISYKQNCNNIIKYRILFGILLFLCLIYSLIDIIFMRK